MDEFSRTQLVLLGVFISFVTSMVTGVVVVSLMRQEPKGVVQTINRVVEHTIEKVVAPAEKEIITETEVITKEVTKEVVIKESDLVADAVQIGLQGVFSLHMNSADEDGPTMLGSGFVVDTSGMMVTDARIFPSTINSDDQSDISNNLFVRYANREIIVEIIARDEMNDVAILKPVSVIPIESSEATEPVAVPEAAEGEELLDGAEETVLYKPLAFADMDTLQLGQLVIALDGEGGGGVRRGIISSLDIAILPDAETKDYVGQLNYVLTDISFDVTGAGGPLLSLDGEVIGLNSIDAGSGVVRAVPAHKILSLIQGLESPDVSAGQLEEKLVANLTE